MAARTELKLIPGRIGQALRFKQQTDLNFMAVSGVAWIRQIYYGRQNHAYATQLSYESQAPYKFEEYSAFTKQAPYDLPVLLAFIFLFGAIYIAGRSSLVSGQTSDNGPLSERQLWRALYFSEGNITRSAQRLGISIVKTVKYDQLPRIISQMPPLDAVLLDVPCSNTAVMARRAEVRLRITSRVIKRLTKIQSRLLQMGTELMTTGAKIGTLMDALFNER